MLQRLGQYINRFTAVYFTALPGNYSKRRVEILQQFYELTNGFLSELGVDYWISYGTLLGHFREGGIIAHDIDVDYSASTTAYQTIMDNLDKMPKALKIYDTSKNHNGPKVYFSYKGFDGDIYFYEPKGDEFVPTLISSNPTEMYPVDSKLIFPLKTEVFLGQETKVPFDTEGYLKHCYGYIGPNAALDPVTGYYYPKGGPKPNSSTA